MQASLPNPDRVRGTSSLRNRALRNQVPTDGRILGPENNNPGNLHKRMSTLLVPTRLVLSALATEREWHAPREAVPPPCLYLYQQTKGRSEMKTGMGALLGRAVVGPVERVAELVGWLTGGGRSVGDSLRGTEWVGVGVGGGWVWTGTFSVANRDGVPGTPGWPWPCKRDAAPI